MKERPILFSAPMVNAILNGTKTVTRRTVKLPNGCVFGNDYAGQIIDTKHQNMLGHYIEFPIDELHCPYGQVGDQFWVRETWLEVGNCDPGWLLYRATDYMTQVRKYGFDTYLPEKDVKWKPSIFMPRWASRIQLEITGVRVERLQDISEKDALAEGCKTDWAEGDTLYWFEGLGVNKESGRVFAYDAKEAYSWLWESINGAGSWAANPWVWVVEFRRVE